MGRGGHRVVLGTTPPAGFSPLELNQEPGLRLGGVTQRWAPSPLGGRCRRGWGGPGVSSRCPTLAACAGPAPVGCDPRGGCESFLPGSWGRCSGPAQGLHVGHRLPPRVGLGQSWCRAPQRGVTAVGTCRGCRLFPSPFQLAGASADPSCGGRWGQGGVCVEGPGLQPPSWWGHTMGLGGGDCCPEGCPPTTAALRARCCPSLLKPWGPHRVTP